MDTCPRDCRGSTVNLALPADPTSNLDLHLLSLAFPHAPPVQYISFKFSKVITRIYILTFLLLLDCLYYHRIINVHSRVERQDIKDSNSFLLVFEIICSHWRLSRFMPRSWQKCHPKASHFRMDLRPILREFRGESRVYKSGRWGLYAIQPLSPTGLGPNLLSLRESHNPTHSSFSYSDANSCVSYRGYQTQTLCIPCSRDLKVSGQR